jgi:hypothetical protein
MALCYLQADTSPADVAAMVEALQRLAREVAAPAGDAYWSISAPAAAA